MFWSLWYSKDFEIFFICSSCYLIVSFWPFTTFYTSISLDCKALNLLRYSSIRSCVLSSSFDLAWTNALASYSYWFFIIISVYLYLTLSCSTFSKNISYYTFVFSTESRFLSSFYLFSPSSKSVFFICISSTSFAYFAFNS